ncbi:LysR family transcriptional regulator, partial [Acinetobacter baumannii]|nr:LysR family transcriptional regulator [Acinetobacter baumannii]EKZ2497836.1 LysR family transcriptional regulator [Acinetobacter baumannii]ELB3511333.1 LysR family transcriptional regulator [Acinetobacter baumannii]
GALCISNLCATKPCDKETGHEYTIRTLVEQHNIAEAYTLKT